MKDVAQQPAVLVAEADAIVAMDLSDALEGAGYRVLGPFATAAEALLSLEREAPSVAVVDLVLKEGPSDALIARLRQCRLPFLVHSGLERDDPAARDVRDEPWLRKPALPWDVVALLDALTLDEPAIDQPALDEPALAAAGSAPAHEGAVHAPPTHVEPVGRASAGDAPTAPVRRLRAARGRNPLVRKLEGFAALSEADEALLERISAPSRIVPSQTDLAREGDAPQGVFLILEGIACRHKVRATGTRQITAYLVPGDLCDLDVALLDAMDHSITTLSACRVVLIPPRTVVEVMESHPRIARALRMTTLVDEATLREWLVNVGCRSALERLAHLFCELRIRLQVVGLAEDDSYDLPLTQLDLADTTGLSNVHLNRTLQELRRSGLIEFRGKRVRILDLPRLRALAEFKPNYLHLGERAAA
ncbi:helix-turn-helix domain-containing protein [Methylobacterium sp. WL6]|uniref:helix-turn-helix domain-containing protein n=1 Tax=Methylobacterium sp. WL6 TaxID=2603901 RepID=UPI0011C8AF13|nr:helix-turn-helix domain-containing protein [Methylobacterium sp. WL6]TXN67603.1 helix-turn-helix domain-containing protein [Methylobacterium sp. WL6]